MNCPKCGTENPAGNRFCMKCGTDLTAASGAETGAAAAQTNQATYTAGTAGNAGYASGTAGGPSGGYSSAPGGAGYVPQYAGAGSTAVQGEHVGFGPRFVAYLIDVVLLFVVGIILNVLHLGFLTTLVDIAYFVYFWSTSGQTLGMMALKLKVVRTDGQPLSWSTGIIRYIGLVISTIPIFLGLLWVIWDPQKQGWHDKIASTYVTHAS